jgi:hypothetical protein
MHMLHYRYASFTPSIQLGPDYNWNCFHGSHIYKSELEDHLRVFGTYVQPIGALHHTFEATAIKKEVALEEALNAKVEVLCLRNELRQGQTKAWQDALIIQALKLAKSDFVGM